MKLDILENEILNNLLLIAMLVVIPILINALLKFAKEKTQTTENVKVKKAINKTLDIILTCVMETNQTFVKGLKDKGSFTLDAKEEAFNLTKSRILEILDKETKEILQQEYENVDAFINSSIEANINDRKRLDKE